MPTSSPVALEMRGLYKRFDRPAVDQLDLTIRAGEFYALLGPNGAGKTTTLRMVTGLLKPDAGAISVFGIDALADPIAAKRVMAWVSDEPMIYDKLTPFEYLEFVARLWNVEAQAAQLRAHTLIEWLAPCAAGACALRKPVQGHAAEGDAGRRAGARPQAHHSRRAAHRPRCRLGAAGQARAARARRRRWLVIMTTHILEVAERMADRIGVIAEGRLIAEGTLDELNSKAGIRGESLEDTFLALVAEEAVEAKVAAA